MKYISKLSTLTTLLSIILGFAACDNEQECALYNTCLLYTSDAADE
mgnify:CR=1